METRSVCSCLATKLLNLAARADTASVSAESAALWRRARSAAHCAWRPTSYWRMSRTWEPILCCRMTGWNWVKVEKQKKM